jgi:hypothetical protein
MMWEHKKSRFIDDGEEATLMALKEGLCDGQDDVGQSALSSSPPAAATLLCSTFFETEHRGGRGGRNCATPVFSATGAQAVTTPCEPPHTPGYRPTNLLNLEIKIK